MERKVYSLFAFGALVILCLLLIIGFNSFTHMQQNEETDGTSVIVPVPEVAGVKSPPPPGCEKGDENFTPSTSESNDLVPQKTSSLLKRIRSTFVVPLEAAVAPLEDKIAPIISNEAFIIGISVVGLIYLLRIILTMQVYQHHLQEGRKVETRRAILAIPFLISLCGFILVRFPLVGRMFGITLPPTEALQFLSFTLFALFLFGMVLAINEYGYFGFVQFMGLLKYIIFPYGALISRFIE